jgi:hypothetical protein
VSFGEWQPTFLRKTVCLNFEVEKVQEEEGTRFRRNVGNHSVSDTASYSRITKSSENSYFKYYFPPTANKKRKNVYIRLKDKNVRAGSHKVHSVL